MNNYSIYFISYLLLDSMTSCEKSLSQLILTVIGLIVNKKENTSRLECVIAVHALLERSFALPFQTLQRFLLHRQLPASETKIQYCLLHR